MSILWPGKAADSSLLAPCRLVSRAGGRVRLPKGCEGLEISPLVSYSGEGLRAMCRGRTFRQAHDVFLQARLYLHRAMAWARVVATGSSNDSQTFDHPDVAGRDVI